MTWECWKCGTSVSSDHPPTKIEGVDRYICDHCNPDSAEAELTRLREENARLREALHNSDSLLGTLGSLSDPVVQVARDENAKALKVPS